MDQRRLYVIKLIVSLLFLLFILLLNDVRAERRDESYGKHRNDHQVILDLADELEDEVQEIDNGSEEHLDILSRVSSVSESEDKGENDLYGDEFSELFVEDDVDLEPIYAGAEDYYEYDDPLRSSTSGPEYEELPHCNREENKEGQPKPAVVVSTLDGRVTSLDVSTGAVLWSHQTGGKKSDMLSSSMSKLEVTSRGESVRLLPCLDGGIYRCNGDVVEALPVTADTLLHSSFKFNSDTIFTGGKSTEVWGMALDTGKLVYVCNSLGCKRQRTASKPAQLLVVKRITQTVRAVDPKSGDERWNFSVGQHELNVAGGGCDWMDTPEVNLDDLPSLHFVIPEGVVMGMDDANQLVWQQKLTSPVVSAWRVINGELEQIDLFSTNSVPALTRDGGIPDSQYRASGRDEQQQQPALYVGVYQKQLYIQQSGGMRHKFNSAFRIFTSGVLEEEGGPTEVSFPRVQWRPYLATALSRTPVVNYNKQKHPLLQEIDTREEITAVAIPQQVDYPYDNGYYLFADESGGQLNFSGPWGVPVVDDETLMDDVASHIIRICFQIGPDTCIKLGCALFLYGVLHYLVLRWVLSQMRQQLRNQAIRFVSLMLHHIILNNPHIINLIQRMGVQLPQLPAPPPPPPYQNDNPSLLSEELQRSDSTSQFTSRYLTDFKPVQCLGRGGFGVVFQVYNKLDENEYAVKRITLPAKEASAERVKREVRALAKLNHTNIVRYYNSWLESPPVGWQDETEVQFKLGDTISNTVFSREEETQDHPSAPEAANKSLDESSKDSLAEVVKKLNNPQISEFSSGFSRSEVDSFDRDDDNDELETSSENSKQVSFAKYEDSSLDIVFENSLSKDNCSTNNPAREDSFEIVFEQSEKVIFEHSEDISEQSENISGKLCDTTNDSISNKKLLEELSDGRAHDLLQTEDSQSIKFGHNYYHLTEDSQSIVFMETSQENQKNNLSVPSVQSSTSTHSSRPNKDETGTSQDCFITEQNVKRRRVKSQPVQQERVAGDERPRTLSLGTTVENTPPAVVKLEPQSRSKTFLYIQMELCQKESLKDWLLKNCKERQEKVIYSMFNDIVRAVEYVHDNQLMHRDLKPSNIFFSLDGEIKIGDFGLVTTITEGEPEIRTPADANPSILSSHRHTHRVGTQLYMSPEQVDNQVYDYKVDIYSMGLIFFEMLVPFSTGMERLSVMSSLREGHFPKGFSDKYPDETELLKLMLSKNPANRPTTRGIRARNPLRPLQGSAVDDIKPEDHFRLNRQRSHTRSHSGSSFSFTSSSSST